MAEYALTPDDRDVRRQSTDDEALIRTARASPAARTARRSCAGSS
jgi:hypothetical protein